MSNGVRVNDENGNMIKAIVEVCEALISDTVAKAEREAYKKGYADKGIEELMKHENDKGNQI